MDKLPIEELTNSLETQITRRTIVRTGAKLAYVAPLVAVTFKLTGSHASAASGSNPECRGADCATFTPCSTNSDCVCVDGGSAGGFCVPGSTSCGVVGPCGSDGSCPAGSFCAYNTCCGEPVCAPFVLTELCLLDLPGGASTQGIRESSGPGTFAG